MFNSIKNKALLFATTVGGLVASGAAMATPSTPIEDLFAAVDIDGVADLVTTLGIAVVSIALVYAGVRLVKRAISAI
jgi:hypothetical protein